MARVRFDKLLKRKKWSKYELAKRLDYPYKSINKLFKVSYNPRLATLSKHAKALKVRVRDLIEE